MFSSSILRVFMRTIVPSRCPTLCVCVRGISALCSLTTFLANRHESSRISCNYTAHAATAERNGKMVQVTNGGQTRTTVSASVTGNDAASLLEGATMKKPIHIIAAVAKNGVIGAGGRLPWRLPCDRQFFMNMTHRKVLIMGRHTFERELHGRPIPGRANIVLSKKPSFTARGARSAQSVEQAVQLAQGLPGDVIWIAGGHQPYHDALPLAQRLYITLLERPVAGDARFPSSWRKYFGKCIWRDEQRGEPDCTFLALRSN